MARIHLALKSLGIVSMVDDDGDIGVAIFPHLLYFMTEPSKPYLGVAAFHRSIDVQHAQLAASFVVRHNSEFYAPKLYTVVSDDGKIRFRLSYCFNWEMGASDEQLEAELDTFLRAAMDALGRIDSSFPDQWALAANEGDE